MTIENRLQLIIDQINDVIREIDFDEGQSLNDEGKDCVLKLKQCRFKLRECKNMGDYIRGY